MGINDSVIKLIKKYQTNKPPLTPPRCMHYPTCSHYAIECYQKFNFFKASFYTIKRIIFCTPLNKKFYDPVPLNKEEKIIAKNYSQIAKSLNEILMIHQHKYPLMELNDYLLLIYESTFIINYEDVKFNEEDVILKEELGNDFQRIYVKNINSLIIKDVNGDATLYRYRLMDLKKLIKKKVIKLNKLDSLKQIDKYILEDFGYVKHSKKYLDNYNSSYIVIKKPGK